MINFGCQNVARGLNFARFGVRKGDPSGPVRRKSYDFAFRVPLCFEKRVNVGMCFEKRVHVRSDPSPTPLLFGVGGSGRRPVNPPTPRSGVRRGEGKLNVGNCGLGGSERGSGRWGLGSAVVPIAQSPPSDFRGALIYNHYFCLRGLQWFPLDSLNVPRGALSFPGKHSEVRSGRFSIPKLRFGSIIGP